MKKWLVRLVLASIVGYFVYGTYATYRAGYYSLPELPDNAQPISFKSGFRAILKDVVASPSREYMSTAPNFLRRLHQATPDRKYLSYPFEVQNWFKDAWSWCDRPTDEEKDELSKLPDEFQRAFQNARFEGICWLDIDGERVLRGLLFSVPKL